MGFCGMVLGVEGWFFVVVFSLVGIIWLEFLGWRALAVAVGPWGSDIRRCGVGLWCVADSPGRHRPPLSW